MIKTLQLITEPPLPVGQRVVFCNFGAWFVNLDTVKEVLANRSCFDLLFSHRDFIGHKCEDTPADIYVTDNEQPHLCRAALLARFGQEIKDLNRVQWKPYVIFGSEVKKFRVTGVISSDGEFRVDFLERPSDVMERVLQLLPEEDKPELQMLRALHIM